MQPTKTDEMDTKDLLRQYFGHTSFRDGQERVIASLLEGHSAAAVFPTGGGKSLCYQLPAIALDGLTLVVSPLIALMKDQIDALQQRGISAARLDSSLTSEEYQQVNAGIRDGSLKLLYVAPERFKNERFREQVCQQKISLFAVDEAHCISEWGHNFRPDYLKLASFVAECEAERVLALTATAPPQVFEDICREFQIRKEHAVRTDFYRENLRLLSTSTSEEERNDLLVARLRKRDRGSTIVYVTLQRTAAEVAEFLQSKGFDARHYHAGLKPEQRAATQDWFIQSDDTIVVATIAFGMGIDKPNIRFVYHYNVAKSIENYAQEIGRSGRDGEPAVCETFLVPEDLRTLENFVHGDTPDDSAIHSFVADVFSQGPEFGISVYAMSGKHDIRDLVIRTLLTYLELDGYLDGGTPFYAEYKFKPLKPSAEILSQFQGERRDFLKTLFKQAKKGRIWFKLNLETCIAATKSDRQRVIRALDYLAEQNMIELQVAGVHHRYRVLKSPDINVVAKSLIERTQKRQQRELERLRHLIQLFAHDGCHVSALGEYFGEPLPQPCGHCGWCELGTPTKIANADATTIDPNLWSKLQAVRKEHPEILSSPRCLARFACGIRSPLISKGRLGQHELFGCFAHVPFETIIQSADSSQSS